MQASTQTRHPVHWSCASVSLTLGPVAGRWMAAVGQTAAHTGQPMHELAVIVTRPNGQ
jgi:hypothetical protein